MPGTITPEPEPVDADSEAALPSRVDHRDVGRRLGTGSGDPRRAPDPLQRLVSSRAELDGEPAAVEVAREAVARARGSARASPRRAARSPRRSRPRSLGEPVEQREPVGDQHAARGRRRVRDDLVAAEGVTRQRPPPDDAVGGEVGGRDSPRPSPAGARRSRAPELAAVERRRAPARRSARACRRGRGGGAVSPATSRGVGRRRAGPRRVCRRIEVEDRVQVRLRPRQLDAVAGELERRLRAAAARAAIRRRGARPRGPATRARHGAGGRCRSGRPASSRCRSRRRRPPSRRRLARAARAPARRRRSRSSRVVRSRARWTSMKPPAPGPVSGLSATQEAKAAATQASTAFPPSASTRGAGLGGQRMPGGDRPAHDRIVRRTTSRAGRSAARADRPRGTSLGCTESGLRARRSPPRPVAITVTQIWPVRRSSIVAPKMRFVSSTAPWRTTSAASLTSNSDRSSPPAIESRIPRAPAISVSISGERSARSAASRARFSPVAIADPHQRVAAVLT